MCVTSLHMSGRNEPKVATADLRDLGDPVAAVFALTEALRVRHAELGPDRLAQLSALLSEAARDLVSAYEGVAGPFSSNFVLLSEHDRHAASASAPGPDHKLS